MLLKAKKLKIDNMEMTVTITEEKGKIRGAIYGDRQLVKFVWFEGKDNPSISKTNMSMDLIKSFINHRLDAQYYGEMYGTSN